jgi:flagellar protein FlaG
MVDQISLVGSSFPVLGSGAPQVAAPRPAPGGTSTAGAAPAQAGAAQDSGPGAHDAAVAQVNQHLQQGQSDLRLQVDPDSGRTIFQIVQEGTGQVLLQVPSAEILGMSRRLQELEAQTRGSGALVDKQG